MPLVVHPFEAICIAYPVRIDNVGGQYAQDASNQIVLTSRVRGVRIRSYRPPKSISARSGSATPPEATLL